MSHLHFSEYIIVLLYTKTVRKLSTKMMILTHLLLPTHMTEPPSNFFSSINSFCEISSKGSTPGSHFARNLRDFGFTRRSWR